MAGFQLYLDVEYEWTLALMTVFFQVPKALHEKHHNYCNQVPVFETENDEKTYQMRYPVRKTLCSDKAKMGLSYAAFLTTVPAWLAH